MPRKIRELISDLKRAGFVLDRQKGSHRQFKHPKLQGVITVSGNEGMTHNAIKNGKWRKR
jgi:predicted RNA binding protein YcfA (HicA-like mRNA interferase family)